MNKGPHLNKRPKNLVNTPGIYSEKYVTIVNLECFFFIFTLAKLQEEELKSQEYEKALSCLSIKSVVHF